jgi:hypothetical protein
MNNTKAIIDFSSYTAAELSPVAQAVHDKMTLNAASFTSPPVTKAALQTLTPADVAKVRAANADRTKSWTAEELKPAARK